MWTSEDTAVAIVDPVVCLVAFIGGIVIVALSDPWPWYNALDHAPWHPPRWVFGVVWMINYILLAAGGILSRYFYDNDPDSPGVFVSSQVMYYLQFLLHIVWIVAFFSFRSLSGGFVVMVALMLSSAAMAVLFCVVHWGAGLTVALYVLWIFFAASLNLYALYRNHHHHHTYISADGDVVIGGDSNARQQQAKRPPLTSNRTRKM
jgi:benzodiazapine receptor